MGDPEVAPIEVLELWIHDGLRALEETWQAEEDGRNPTRMPVAWNEERERIRREIRGVVLFAIASQAVDAREVTEVARALAAQGLSDPLGTELQSPGLEALAVEARERLGRS